MSETSAKSTLKAMNRSDIDDTLKDMWATRPRRYKSDRKIAGVAAAIARRYEIDPTLVRVAFVVAAVYGGAGVILYLLGWLLLPAENDEVSPAEAALGRGHSSMSTALTWVLGIALIPFSISMFSRTPSMLISLALIGAGLFLLHRHRGHLGQGSWAPPVPGTAPTAPTAPIAGQPIAGQPTVPGSPPTAPGATTSRVAAGAAEATVGMPRPTDQAAPTDPARPTDQVPEPPTPPAWDPLGAAPFAWDLPEPGAQHKPPRRRTRRRSPVTPLTIGLALVTAGVGAFATMYDSYFTGPRVLAMVLAVIGGGLLVGSFVRGGRGLIPLAIPLAIITWAIAVAPVHGWDGFGDERHAPTTVADVRPVYELGAGDIEVDLTGLPLTSDDIVPPIRVQLGAGNVKVIVPENADVTATCSAGLGNIECLDRKSDGPARHLRVTDFGEDGPGGGTLQLDLSTRAGDVKLMRG